MANPALAALLQRPDIWRGDELAQLSEAGIPTGYPALDAELPGGGWPRGDLTEFLGDAVGVGEVSLLLPALVQLSEAGGWVALVAPPWRVHAPAWAARGIRLDRLVVAQTGSGRHAGKESAWCCEQLLGSGSFAAVLAWLDGSVGPSLLRRLQVAASGHQSLAFLWRPESTGLQPSPAPLRLQFQGSRHGLGLRILKRRGRPASQGLNLPVATSLRTRKNAHAVASPVFSTIGAECARSPRFA